MTEDEWLAATDPKPMLQFIREKASERKLRLFTVACCRRVWLLLKDERGRKALETAEAYADGLATQDELIFAYVTTNQLIDIIRSQSRNIHKDAKAFAMLAVQRAASAGLCFYGQDWEHDTYDPSQCASDAVEYVEKGSAWLQKADTLRCIFGNPFRPVAVDPSWFTSDVLALAEGIYQEKAFDRMPILADALQDAGCDSDELLNHCRGDGPHVRGCWALDLVLGKS
jgi:hypothetical protein